MQPRITSATADLSGNVAEVTFPQVPVRREWVGPVAVPNANSTARWQVFRERVALGVMYGASSYGPVKVLAGQSLSIIGTGVAPGLVVNPTWDAVDAPAGTTPDVAPAATALTVSTTRPALLLDSYTMVGGNNGQVVTKTYAVDPNARALSIALVRTAGPTTPFTLLTVTGVQSGLQYLSQSNPSQTNQRPAYNLIAFNAAIDAQLTVAVTMISTGGGVVFIAEEFDPLLIGVESIADGANITTDPVQVTALAETTHSFASAVATAFSLTGTRGFEVRVFPDAAVDAHGVSLYLSMTGTASPTQGMPLLPGDFYARRDVGAPSSLSFYNNAASAVSCVSREFN